MPTGAVEWPGAVHKHLLNQMLPATEKNIPDLLVVLDDTAKFFLHSIIAVFENLLEFIEHNHDILVAFRCDLCRRIQHLVERCA